MIYHVLMVLYEIVEFLIYWVINGFNRSTAWFWCYVKVDVHNIILFEEQCSWNGIDYSVYFNKKAVM